MDNYVKICFMHDAFEGSTIESAWAKKLENGYELDNILFYAKNYSWGDIISAEERDGELFVTGLIKEMGHSTVRVLVSEVDLVEPLRNALKDLGCSSELSNYEKLIAVDVPPEVSYSTIRVFLDKGEDEEKWQYQEACIAANHR